MYKTAAAHTRIWVNKYAPGQEKDWVPPSKPRFHVTRYQNRRDNMRRARFFRYVRGYRTEAEGLAALEATRQRGKSLYAKLVHDKLVVAEFGDRAAEENWEANRPADVDLRIR